MSGIKYTCNGPRILDEETGEPTVDERGLAVRAPCGNDVSAVIEALPIDGTEQVAECPKCGNQISVRRVPVEDVEANKVEED